MTEFDRYWSGNSRVTADLLSDLTVLIRGFFQRQITEQNLTHACLAGTISNFIIFDRMKDKLVVNSITEFDRYWSGNSRVTADLLSDLTVLICVFFQRQITEQNLTQACLTGTIPNFIIFDRIKDILVVNSITEFDRYWSGNSRVTADLLSDLTVVIRVFFQRQITEHN